MKPIFVLWQTQYTRLLHSCQGLFLRDIHITLQRQIDRLVYELYGLTGEEIGIVEGAT